MERGSVTYPDTGITMLHIRGTACSEYVENLKDLSVTKIPDLSGLDEMAFTDWRVMRKYETR